MTAPHPQPADPTAMLAQAAAASQEARDAPLPEPLFRTKRLLVRPMHPQDAESHTVAAAPASITKFMTLAFPHPYTIEHAKTWYQMNKDAPNNHLVLVLPSAPATVIGSIGLIPGKDIESHVGTIGYWMSEPYQGQGLMSEALAGMVEYTFLVRNGDGSAPPEDGTEKTPEVKKTKLIATVAAGNEGSARTLEKCGFRREGLQRGQLRTRDGVLRDQYMYGLTREEWEEMRERERGGAKSGDQ